MKYLTVHVCALACEQTAAQWTPPPLGAATLLSMSTEKMRHTGEATLCSTPGTQACERSVTSSEHPRQAQFALLHTLQQRL